MAQSSLLDNSPRLGQESVPKRRRTSKSSLSALAPARPKIMGEVLKRALDKFEVNSKELTLSNTPISVPLFSTLQLPILMSLSRIQSMSAMHNWGLEHKQDIADNLPLGTELARALSVLKSNDIFARIMSGVHVLSYDHLLRQCKEWQKQYLYTGHLAHAQLDQIKLNLTQDVNEHLAKFELHYNLLLNDKAIVYLDTPPEHVQDYMPLSLGNVLQAFDAQGMILKTKLLQCSASTLERVFASGAHLLLEITEANKDLYALAIQGLRENNALHYVSEKYGLEFSLISSTELENPMHRARLALTGWICQVKQAQSTTIYLMWWQKDILSSLEKVAEACYYLQGAGPRWYWSNDTQDYARLALSPECQRLGRNYVLLGRFVRYVLNHEMSFKSLYSQKYQCPSTMSKEKLQSCLDTVQAGSAVLMRYMLSRNML